MTAPAPPGATPSLARRMASFVYEGLLLFGIGLIPGAIGALFVALTGHEHPLQSDTALRIITLVIYAVYFSWFWSARGQTLPMQTWHIRVVTADGRPLSQIRALTRFVAAPTEHADMCRHSIEAIAQLRDARRDQLHLSARQTTHPPSPCRVHHVVVRHVLRIGHPPRVSTRGEVPRSVLLLDDVLTTGATLSACARALRSAGAIRVAAITFTRRL